MGFKLVIIALFLLICFVEQSKANAKDKFSVGKAIADLLNKLHNEFNSKIMLINMDKQNEKLNDLKNEILLVYHARLRFNTICF